MLSFVLSVPGAFSFSSFEPPREGDAGDAVNMLAMLEEFATHSFHLFMGQLFVVPYVI